MAAFLTKALRALVALFAVLALVACAQIYRNSGNEELPKADPQALRVGTYNVHYILARSETGPWSLADWGRRKEPLDQAFKFIDADLVAFQEMESHSGPEETQVNLKLDFLLANNTAYAPAASGDPAVFPNTQPILYRKERLEMMDQGWFFFSETPDVIYSRTFNGSFPAYATWAAFRDTRTGAAFRVVNIHTDFASRSNRLQSVALVAERIGPWIEAGETVLVVGDLNGLHGSRTLEVIEEVGVTFAPVRGATYHLNRGLNLFGAIDHIGWAGDVSMASAPIVVRRKFSGEWPTDHYPLVIDLELR
jgi:endonuclease/exonuclease/phosphatase family metal-dependent hydrolase